MAAKKPSYQEHLAALEKIRAAASDSLPSALGVLCVYGTSEYLLGRAVTTLRRCAANSGMPCDALEAAALTDSLAAAIGEQASLFDPATFYVLQRVEQARALPRLLKLLPQAGALTNILCLVLKGEGPNAALKTELTRLKAHLIPCFDPWPNETPPIAAAMAQEKGLKLRPEALRLVIDAVGNDLVKLDNELGKLALIFATAPSPLSQSDVSPHLGMLREDDAFQLDRLLLAKQWSKALCLAHDLIARGEKALALLAIVAGHCRNAARVTSALRSGAREADIAKQVRLPPYVLKNYVQSLRGQAPARYLQALTHCHEVDLLLKSTPTDEGLLIASIVERLAVPTVQA